MLNSNVGADMTAKSESDTRKMISCAKGNFSEWRKMIQILPEFGLIGQG